jgi:hypothetical protein
MLRIPHCLDSRLIDGGKVVSLTHRPHITLQKHYYSNAMNLIVVEYPKLTFHRMYALVLFWASCFYLTSCSLINYGIEMSKYFLELLQFMVRPWCARYLDSINFQFHRSMRKCVSRLVGSPQRIRAATHRQLVLQRARLFWVPEKHSILT